MEIVDPTFGGLVRSYVTVARSWVEITFPKAVRGVRRGLPSFVMKFPAVALPT